MEKKHLLNTIIDLGNKETSEATDLLRRLLLDFGSDTPDNAEAVKNVIYVANEKARGVGTTSGILASEILNKLEETGIPPEVKSTFPTLDEIEWESILRYCTLVLCALEEIK